jgi:hypothetical protein
MITAMTFLALPGSEDAGPESSVSGSIDSIEKGVSEHIYP